MTDETNDYRDGYDAGFGGGRLDARRSSEYAAGFLAGAEAHSRNARAWIDLARRFAAGDGTEPGMTVDAARRALLADLADGRKPSDALVREVAAIEALIDAKIAEALERLAATAEPASRAAARSSMDGLLSALESGDDAAAVTALRHLEAEAAGFVRLTAAEPASSTYRRGWLDGSRQTEPDTSGLDGPNAVVYSRGWLDGDAVRRYVELAVSGQPKPEGDVIDDATACALAMRWAGTRAPRRRDDPEDFDFYAHDSVWYEPVQGVEPPNDAEIDALLGWVSCYVEREHPRCPLAHLVASELGITDGEAEALIREAEQRK